MRLKALLLTAGLAVAAAGPAMANPEDTCKPKPWLAELICKAQQNAHEERQRTAFQWVRRYLDQLGKSTMSSSSERPSTSPAATEPSVATSRKDGTLGGTRSP